VTSPLACFLLSRCKPASLYTVIRFFVPGILLAGLLLYHRQHSLLTLLRTWLSPVAEGALIFFLIRRFRQGRRMLGTEQQEGLDFLSYSRILLAKAMNNEKIGNILASELAVFYYLVAGARKTSAAAFTSYKGNGIRLILGVFIGCIFVEAAALHFLAGMWSGKLAWILTALSVYTALQLYAHWRAIRTRPILLGAKDLYLRNGLMADVHIRMEDIEEIGVTRKTDPAEGAVTLALFRSLEGHNIRIRLRQPADILRPFGLRRQATIILFFIDRPDEFVSIIRERVKG
jgi:hypothetical protein